MSRLVEAARALADAVLVPAAERVDVGGELPREHLDALRRERLFGVWAPVEHGGEDAARSDARLVYEALAGGCGSTYFVWMQHQSLVRKLAASDNGALAAEWLPPLAAGERVAGDVNYLRRAGPPLVRVRSAGGDWALEGAAPWVASWGIADVFIVAAVAPANEVLYLLVPADARGLRGQRLTNLVAMSAAGCARVELDAVRVPARNVIARIAWESWRARDPRRNGGPMPAALGVAERAVRLALLEADRRDDDALRTSARALADELRRCRAANYDADDMYEAGEEVPLATQVAARVWSHDLSLRAASALLVASGGAGVQADHPAQRLLREAAFHAIQAQTRDVKLATVAGVVRRDWGGHGADTRDMRAHARSLGA